MSVNTLVHRMCPRGAATYSPCGHYRYTLQRDLVEPSWDYPRSIVWLMLNPSTATHEANDPTVERCERRSREMGFERFIVLNLFAYRATDPRDMKAAADPIGPMNNAAIVEHCMAADTIVAAWGAHGSFRDRDADVLRLLEGLPLTCLGATKAGKPRHPLYVGYSTGLQPFAAGGQR